MKKQLLVSFMAATLTTSAFAVEVSDQLEVFGTIEVEYGNVKIKQTDGTSTTEKGTALATGAFGSVIKPNDKFDITTSFLYEEDLNAVATPLELDEAFVTWHAMPEKKLDVIAGKKYLSFGKYDTSMVSDPLTLELGETNLKEVLEVSGKNGNISGAAYTFKGDTENGYGLRVDYGTETLSAGVDYLSKLADEKVPAYGVHASSKLGKITLLGEYIAATKTMNDGTKPTATHLEASYDLNNDRTIALAWDKTKQADQIGLDKTAYGVAYRQPLYKDLTGALELRQSKGYDDSKTRALTAQVAYEF